MYDEKLNWNKSSTRGKPNILELRFFCAQPKTTSIHDSNVHYHAKISSHWISNLESKANVITFGRIWYAGLILAVVNKNSELQLQSPKHSQILPSIQ
jgi:predicted phosphohydrolase